MQSLRLPFVLACVAVGCDGGPAPRPGPTAPWPASAAASPGSPPRDRAPVALAVVPSASIAFELPAKDGRPTGVVRLARGRLDLDLLDLRATRGRVEADLGSLEVHGADEVDARFRTEQGRSWLELGASRPAAARDALRWASFDLDAIEEVSAERAHEGKPVEEALLPPKLAEGGEAPRVGVVAPPRRSRPLGAPSAGPDVADAAGVADTGDGAAARPVRRQVDLVARGRLTVHGRRVERRVALRAVFEWQGEPAPGMRPDRVTLASRGPLVVSLLEHDVVPRDSLGAELPRERHRLGTEVGRDARVWVWLVLRPAD